jgi:hypothetical protein
MRKKGHVVFSVLSIVGFLALLIPVYFYLRSDKIARTNRLIEEAKDQYFAREFLSAYKTYEQLIDSSSFYDDAALINYANSGFLSSNILKNGFYGRGKGPDLPDTALQKLANHSQSMYSILTTSEKSKIASMAHNQLGYATIKSAESFTDESDADSIFFQSLEHFKQALKKDPNNDSARYNYELIKKALGFPETVLQETRSLIAQRRYIEAAGVLEAAMARDLRLAKQKEFLQRIKAVAGIDTTYRRGRL